MDVKSVSIEEWLGTLLHRKTGKPLADPTKQRIRNIFSVMFTHAQRYEFVPINHNPVKLVRQSGKRSKIPDILDPAEINLLWTNTGPRECAAIALNFGNGLRRSEAFALKWSDLDLESATALVNKGIVKGVLGKVKTEVSKKLVPLHAFQIGALRAWREVSPYREDHDWVFASHQKRGKMPMWPDMILRWYIQPLAKKLGIEKNIGWHTFRRTFSTLLTANHEDVKTVQELLRHANANTTLNLYSQGVSKNLRKAQSKVIQMVRKPAVSNAKKGPNFICAPVVPQKENPQLKKMKVSALK
jgi:integrase